MAGDYFIQSIRNMKEYHTKVIDGIQVNRESVSPEDFVALLNEVSFKLDCLRNLGSYVNIMSVEQSETYCVVASNTYVKFDVNNNEKPGATLKKDSSSTDPNDYDFTALTHEEISRYE